MTRDRSFEWWIAVVRLLAIPLAIVQVALTSSYPAGYEGGAWALAAGFVVGALVIFLVVRESATVTVQVLALCFDFAVISGYTILFAFETSPSTRQLLYLAIVMGAARFGLAGGLLTAAATIPVTVWYAARREHFSHVPYTASNVVLQIAEGFLIALLVGWLYLRIDEQRHAAEQRALEAEGLRDELGRRADLLDAANRCARALNSSLDLDEAFGAFIRELRGLVPFTRTAIIQVEDGTARVVAAAGARADDAMPAGTVVPIEHSILADVLDRGQTVYRHDLAQAQFAEEPGLMELGLRSRVVAPLLVGARPIGILSLSRGEPDAFTPHEVELVALLGRLVATAVQNIRAYDAERRTVEELRRLSTLRADFVSVVSHELRSPMAAVIGAARTLQARWRELSPEQREAFLGLIGDETNRLATLVGDVLDTSRIDGGTFTYRFADVDLAALVSDSVAAASIGQDEVRVRADIPSRPTVVRGDGERLRQVIGNLIDNAVKYSPAGGVVDVRVAPSNGSVLVSVSDAGPGIPASQQTLIFEKFGRVPGEHAKPGTGLGLYIARSIAEAHGGTLDVSSTTGRGATFTLLLPPS